MKLEKPNKALRKEIREGIHRIDDEDYVLLDYHHQEIERAKKEVFDDIETLSRPLSGEFGETPIRKDYLKLKEKHLGSQSKHKG